MNSSLILISVLVLALVLAPSVTLSDVWSAKKVDKQAKKAIDKALSKYVSKKYSQYCEIAVTTKSNNISTVIYDKDCAPPPVTPPPSCPPGTHLENGVCVPDPVPPPPSNSVKVALVGDISGTAVRDAIRDHSPDLVVGLGDLTYSSTLKSFKDNYGVFGAKLRCVIGNHDSTEDGSSSIYQEAIAYCGEAWFLKLQGGHVFFGINTNGDLSTSGAQFQNVKAKLTDSAFMSGVKAVHITSHKPCHSIPPNSHHPIESKVKAFCSAILQEVPSGVTVYFENGHNHIMSASANGLWYQSGAGGRSHYSCGTSSEWPMCDNSKYGFLELAIDKNTGATVGTFYDTGGNKVN